jgi:hypothetical protein
VTFGAGFISFMLLTAVLLGYLLLSQHRAITLNGESFRFFGVYALIVALLSLVCAFIDLMTLKIAGWIVRNRG